MVWWPPGRIHFLQQCFWLESSCQRTWQMGSILNCWDMVLFETLLLRAVFGRVAFQFWCMQVTRACVFYQCLRRGEHLTISKTRIIFLWGCAVIKADLLNLFCFVFPVSENLLPYMYILPWKVWGFKAFFFS